MSLQCKNCQQTFTGHYCNYCGQPADTHKLDAHFLLHDLQHGLLHFDRGILYSARELFTRPGHSIREFLAGKRVNHFKPVSLVVVLATLYGLLYHTFDISLMGDQETVEGLDLKSVNEWLATHFAWMTLATIPLYTVGTIICFGKQGYNWVELFILNTFKAAQRIFAHLALFPLLYCYNGTPAIKTVSAALYLTDLLLIFWTNLQFFNRLSYVKAFLLTLLSHLIFLALFISILVLAILFWPR